MTVAEFRAALGGDQPPADLPPLLIALWHAARGDWSRAHELAQDVDDRDGPWVHAYLHRKEGDLGNAGYWYRRAGRPAATDSFESEWERIVEELLRRPGRGRL